MSADSKYIVVLNELKAKIKQARVQAIFHVNHELLRAYWEIGNVILIQQRNEGWGTKVIERLARDLRLEFPELKGLSLRNLKYMRSFAEAYPFFPIVQAPLAQLQSGENAEQNSIVQASLAQLSWYHHISLLDKVKDPEIRQF